MELNGLKGHSCIVLGIASNGTEEQAAVITRDWKPDTSKPGRHLVNVTVFPDCATPFTRGSIVMCIDEGTAREGYAAMETKEPVCWLT